MCSKPRQLWTMAAICLGCALVLAAANPAMARPYNKQPIYDGFDLFANTLSGYPTFQFSNNGDIVYQTRAWSTTLGRWAYSLYLYRQGGGTSLIPSGTEIKFDLQINDLGQVVWSETDSTVHHNRVYLYRNGVTIPISNPSFDSGRPRLNSTGKVVYTAWVYINQGSNDEELFLYDGNAYGQITNHHLTNARPVINSSGQVAWYSANYSPIYVYFYNGSDIRQISTVGDATKLQLSDDGQIIWVIGPVQPTHYELYLYKGGDPALNTVQLTANIDVYLAPNPRFGANGQVLWTEKDSNGNRYLYQYRDGNTSQISRIDLTEQAFSVNRQGEIAFGMGSTIYLYSHNTTRQISPSNDPSYPGGCINPIINERGQICYFAGSFSQFDYTSHQTVFMYNGGITKIDGSHTFGYNRDLQLINNGQIAWFEQLTFYFGQPNEMKIWLATPVSGNAAITLLLLN
jgi:hypothetical protein